MNVSVSVGAPNAESKVENLTFDEIQIGQSASMSKSLTSTDLELFATISGNTDPAHLDEHYAAEGLFHTVVAHGMWSGSLFSGVLGTKLPGPGTIYLSQDLHFTRPVTVGDVITATVTVKDKRADKNVVVFDCKCTNQYGKVVVEGVAEVLAPVKKVSVPAYELPQVQMIRHDGHAELLRKCQSLEPIPVAVVHPCDKSSLTGAVEAAREKLIVPILVGPEGKIKETADKNEIDISGFQIVDAEHSVAAAAKSVALARAGEAMALMKGSLHTDEVMGAAVKRDIGLRTGSRISHVFVMNVPTYPKPLLVTDAVVNIAPELEDKISICQNAINLAHVLGIENPNVAILSAVEVINSKIISTLDAAALCKMADRGQITGGTLDGPLAFDNAISAEAAKTKGITSKVAGNADILLVPDLVSGNILYKELCFLANADAAGIILGTRVPIILTSRADNVRTRLASAALAVLIARHGSNK